MKKISPSLIVFLSALLSGCAGLYIPPEEGVDVANLKIESNSGLVTFLYMDNDKCDGRAIKRFANKAGETYSTKIPSGFTQVIDARYLNGTGHCKIKLKFLPEKNQNYVVKYLFYESQKLSLFRTTNASCTLQIFKDFDGKLVPDATQQRMNCYF